MEHVSVRRRSLLRWFVVVVMLVLAVRAQFLPAWMMSIVIVGVFVAAVLAIRSFGNRLVDQP